MNQIETQNPVSISQINFALITWHAALKFPKDLTPELSEIWFSRLRANQVSEAEFQPVVTQIIDAQPDFPAPADALKIILAERQRRAELPRFESANEILEHQKMLGGGISENCPRESEAIRRAYRERLLGDDQEQQAPAARIGFKPPTAEEISATAQRRKAMIDQVQKAQVDTVYGRNPETLF